MDQATRNNRSLVGLDLIRFAAAAMVVWFHLSYWSWAGSGATARMVRGSVSFPDLAPYASFGWVGVEIFFVLSGLVIAYSAEGKSSGSFALSRFLRLYPAAWICSTMTAVVLVAADMFSPVGYIKSMLLWPKGKWVTGAYWTLGIEMAFYALVFLLLAMKRFDRIGQLFAVSPW